MNLLREESESVMHFLRFIAAGLSRRRMTDAGLKGNGLITQKTAYLS